MSDARIMRDCKKCERWKAEHDKVLLRLEHRFIFCEKLKAGMKEAVEIMNREIRRRGGPANQTTYDAVLWLEKYGKDFSD